MRRILALSFSIIILIYLTACAKTYHTPNGVKTYQKPIEVIYIYHSAFGQRYPEYKIDIENKQFWKYTTAGYDKYVPRDQASDNEGFTFISDLSNEQIEIFLLESARYGFTYWKETYIDDHLIDGHQWGIKIIFYDSSQSIITGSNDYPATWDKMGSAFQKLTGVDILLTDNDTNE